MATLTIVIGLPGSGKTHYCKELCASSGKRFSDVIKNNESLFVVKELMSGNDCCVDDVAFCFQTKRDDFLDDVRKQCQSSPKVSFVYFAFEPLKCLINVVGDAVAEKHEWQGRFNAFQNQLKLKCIYDIPDGIECKEVTVNPEYNCVYQCRACEVELKTLERILSSVGCKSPLRSEEATELLIAADALRKAYGEMRNE